MTACGFRMAWTSPCRRDATARGVCDLHGKQKCWCGAQARKECSVASSLVCGNPTCDEHECQRVCAGMTGTYGAKHSKKGFAQFHKWQAKQALAAAKENR